MGSGKTTVGKKLARLVGRHFVDADVEWLSDDDFVLRPFVGLPARFIRRRAHQELAGRNAGQLHADGVGDLRRAVFADDAEAEIISRPVG